MSSAATRKAKAFRAAYDAAGGPPPGWVINVNDRPMTVEVSGRTVTIQPGDVEYLPMLVTTGAAS